MSAGGEATFDFYEDPTFSADGTAVLAVNHNRFKTNVANTLFFHTPTIVTNGDLLISGLQPGGSGGNAQGGSSQSDFEEWILSPGDYLIRIKNIAGVASNISLQLDFYEPQG
jgi:hypothetical protein